MRRFLGFLVAVWISSVSSASDESLMRGATGTYRRFDGMHDEALTLKADRSYVFTTRFDIGSDEEKGVWGMRDGFLLLNVKRRGEVFQKKPSRFLVVVVDGDLALRVQDEGDQSEDEHEPRLLFKRDKKQANQPPEPTRAAVTIPADAGLAPATRVAHL
jgi:hypothetical protein